jgi:glutathione S-transferase
MKQAGDEDVAAAAEANELPPLLDYLETLVPDCGFLIESRITLADIAVASPFVNMDHLGIRTDAARWPKTARYLEAIHARPSFAPVIAAEKAFIAAMA